MYKLFNPPGSSSEDDDEDYDAEQVAVRRAQANQIPATSDSIERVFGVLDHALTSVPNLKLTTASGMTTYRWVWVGCR